MAKRRRKTRTHVPAHQNEEAAKAPKSFVIKSGKVTKSVSMLIQNIRKTLEPNTAARLKERRRNKIKDFVHIAGQLGVSHFVIFSKSDEHTNMRLARSPKGPTLTFRVEDYSLMKDIYASQKNPRSPGLEYSAAPLLVLNNFNKEGNQFKLISSMLQNMFPSLNVHKMKVTDCKRVVLFHYDAESDKIHLRHYFISMKTAGVSKSVKRVVNSALPDLSKFGDISEYILKESALSDSEAEDDTGIVKLEEKGDKTQKRIKLVEIGPRMTLKLTKIQQDLCDGEILFHSFVKKSAEEIEKQRAEFKLKAAEKEKRRQEQQKNVELKQKALEDHKKRCAPDSGFDEEGNDEAEENEGGEDESQEEDFDDEIEGDEEFDDVSDNDEDEKDNIDLER